MDEKLSNVIDQNDKNFESLEEQLLDLNSDVNEI